MPRKGIPQLNQTEGNVLSLDKDKSGETIQDYPRSSTKCLYIANIGNPAAARSAFVISGNLKESGEHSLSDDSWDEIRWDSSIQAILFKPTGGAMIIASTKDRATPSAYGYIIAENGELLVKVGGSPYGALFVKRSSASVTIYYVGYGDNQLLNSTGKIE